MGQGFYSSIIGIIFVLLISYLYCFIGGKSTIRYRLKTWASVSAAYLFSALVFSSSFSTIDFFILSDPMDYISNNSNVTSSASDDIVNKFLVSMLGFQDNNILYNILINDISYFANIYLDGVNSFYYTLVSVVFGILSSITLYRVLSKRISPQKTYKYTLLFSLLSLYHFYSVVVVRDICIAFFYILCFEVIQSKYSLKGILLLTLYMMLAGGFRLYSGLFISAFILYYIYIPISKSKYKIILVPIMGVILIVIISSSVLVINQTLGEIETYKEMTEDAAADTGGLIGKLLQLPPGIKQVVLVFYSQITPLPPYLHLLEAKSISNIYMAVMIIVYEIFWYLVSYTLFYALFVCKYYKRLNMEDILLLLLVLIFIIANTAHPDIRRMMPVYPIIYLYYLKIKLGSSKAWNELSTKRLIKVYVCLLLIYNIIKL